MASRPAGRLDVLITHLPGKRGSAAPADTSAQTGRQSSGESVAAFLKRHKRAVAGAGVAGALLGAAALRRKHRAVEDQEDEGDWISQQHFTCVSRIFEHYEGMQTFAKLDEAELEALREGEGVMHHHLVDIRACERLPDTYLAVEQWVLLVPESEDRLAGPFTTVFGPGAETPADAADCVQDMYIGLPVSRLRVWRTMHSLVDGHTFTGTMQSIVAAAAVTSVDEDDAAAKKLTNCVDLLELGYTRALMTSIALLRALGCDVQAASTLSLGGGAGSIPMLLKTKFPGSEVHVVDVEPVAVDLARTWLGYDDAGLGIRTHIRDAKEFLEDADKGTPLFNIIFVDAYENCEVPEHLGGTESKMLAYLRLIRQHLKPTGVVAGDLICYNAEDYDKGLGAWREVFGDQYLHVLRVQENQWIVLAVHSDGGSRIDVGGDDLRSAAKELTEEFDFWFDLAAQVEPGAETGGQEAAYRRIPE
eukprot:TRINITY_DN4702_c0_g1_i1.p1 TRINITY_DN4702_c0_g1~~TRINITY_DN4702_c0_g1_i1.p1  ORF type:complete len:493 (+),score=171.17 TRINITY_DN4702_c0_g1_i1:57-1481(+)